MKSKNEMQAIFKEKPYWTTLWSFIDEARKENELMQKMITKHVKKVVSKNHAKPKGISFGDISAQCSSEDYDDLGGGAFCILVEGTVYEAKEANKLIKFLIKAERWLANKDKYKRPGRKPKKVPSQKSAKERSDGCKKSILSDEKCSHNNTYAHDHNGDIHCEDCHERVRY